MDKIYHEYCLPPIYKSEIKSDSLNIYQKKKQGETFWSLDVTEDVTDLEEYFKKFYNLYVLGNTNVFVDGPAACGKSTLVNDLNPLKINQFYNINEGNGYNICPEYALAYIVLNEDFSKYENICTDRSIVSNLAYLIAYYCMNLINNNAVYNKSIHFICEEYVLVSNLKPVLEYIRSLKLEVIIFVDSSFEYSAKRMNARGVALESNSNIVKSLCKEYHTAQLAAFSYLANYMNYPCIDFNYIRLHYKVDDDSDLFRMNSKYFQSVISESLEMGNLQVLDITTEITTIHPEVMKELHNNAIKISTR
ncbi:TK2 [Aratus pisonii nudivirus]|nr:TK2 [Aratus pisonii nudivirus]